MSRVVSFRAEDPLYARLREFAQRSSLSEGQAALFLVDAGLGKDPRSAAISTYMRAFSARLKSPVREAIRRISADLERFARTFGDEPTFERVEPPEEDEAVEEEFSSPPDEDEMTPEEAGESGMFDQEPTSAEESGESGMFDREPAVEEPVRGLRGKGRRRGRRGGRR